MSKPAAAGWVAVLFAICAVTLVAFGCIGGRKRDRLALGISSLAAAALALLEVFRLAPRIIAIAACATLVLVARSISGFSGARALLRDAVLYGLVPLAIAALFGEPFYKAHDMSSSYEGLPTAKVLLAAVSLGCANMVLLANSSNSPVERRRLMVRFIKLAWLLSVPWLAFTLRGVAFPPHGVAAAAMEDSSLIAMFLAHITLWYLAVDYYVSRLSSHPVIRKSPE
jgi:outer membrane murein-binding lipoprotein Lpp